MIRICIIVKMNAAFDACNVELDSAGLDGAPGYV